MYFKRKDLSKALQSIGLPGTYHWILKMEKQGRLISPLNPVTGWRQYTEEQIAEIIKAFAPGGSGYWKPGSDNS